MNENDFVRKDVFDERTDHIMTAVNDTRDRVDDIQANVGRQISFWGILIGVIAFLFAGLQLGLAVLLYILTLKP